MNHLAELRDRVLQTIQELGVGAVVFDPHPDQMGGEVLVGYIEYKEDSEGVENEAYTSSFIPDLKSSLSFRLGEKESSPNGSLFYDYTRPVFLAEEEWLAITG